MASGYDGIKRMGIERMATMDEPEIGEAGMADLEVIVTLLADDVLGATRETPPPPLHPGYVAAFRAIEADPHHVILVARSGGSDGGRVIGCLQLSILPSLSRRGTSRAQIENVRVAREARGRGVGEKLVQAAIARAREAGCAMAQLTTDRTREAAHRFYERLGFEPTHVGMKLRL